MKWAKISDFSPQQHATYIYYSSALGQTLTINTHNLHTMMKHTPLYLSLLLRTRVQAQTSTPNVVVILADDVGYGDLGCYGAKNVTTPNIDRLSQQGIRFTNAHAVAATSTPSRYSLLTGEYSWRRTDTDIAAGNAKMIINPWQYTLADLFHSAGYRTGAIGKWHLGLGEETGKQDWNAPLPCGLQDIGFDYHYIMAATADRVPCVFIENGFVANYDPDAPIQVSYEKNFPGEPTGRDNPELLYNLKSCPNHGHNHSIVNGIGRIGYMKGGGKALWKDENIADSIAEHAVRFLEENRDKPFFLYLCTNDIHVPRFPHDRFRGKNKMGLRGDAIQQFDWTVGRVMDALKDLGLDDNTLVLLTSDNGPVVNDGYEDQAEALLHGHSPAGPLRGNKYSAFEGGTRVPFIVRWPEGIRGGKESQVLMSQIDLMATFGEMLGARMPKGQALDSQPHLCNLLGDDASPRPYVIEQSLSHTLSVRTATWKYIEPSDGREFMQLEKVETGNAPLPQLYDMTDDSGERTNVAEKHPQVVYELQNILRKERNRSK